jgi:predicted phage replisome organizer
VDDRKRKTRNASIVPKERKTVAYIITDRTFDDDRIKLIESLPSGDQTLVIFFKLLSLACKSNAGGFLLLSKNLPYTDEMLAALLGRNLQVVKFALSTLEQFGMIEQGEGGFKVTDFIEWLDPESENREQARIRMEKHRETKKELPAPEPKKKKRVYEENDIEMKLAKHLFWHMRQNNSEAKEPNFQKWADEMRLIIERDERKPEQIKNMIDWCQKDSFWKTNILSVASLRKQYDKLKLRAMEEYNQTRSGGNRRQQEVDDIFNRLMEGADNDVSGRIEGN